MGHLLTENGWINGTKQNPLAVNSSANRPVFAIGWHLMLALGRQAQAAIRLKRVAIICTFRWRALGRTAPEYSAKSKT